VRGKGLRFRKNATPDFGGEISKIETIYVSNNI
jgi:hypothetical protein